MNDGIAGNRLPGGDSSGLVGLFRDALAQPGVLWLMPLEGINDITGATRQEAVSCTVTPCGRSRHSASRGRRSAKP